MFHLINPDYNTTGIEVKRAQFRVKLRREIRKLGFDLKGLNDLGAIDLIKVRNLLRKLKRE